MRRIHRYRNIQIWALFIVASWLVLSTGCSLLGDLNDTLFPSPTTEGTKPPDRTAIPSTPIGQETPAPTLASTTTWPAPTQTTQPAPSMSPTAIPQADKGQYLVYAQGGGIYRGDYLGANPIEVASVPRLEAWDFHQGALAMARGSNVDVIDLNRGSLSSFQINLGVKVEYSFVLWGVSGESILYAAVIDDKAALTLGRSVHLRAVDPETGTELGAALLRDVTGAQVLRYDEDLRRVLLIPYGGDPAFAKAEYYDLGNGKLIGVFPVQGEGEAIISPDGRYLLTEQSEIEKGKRHLTLYDLSTGGQERPKVWEHPQRSHSVSHIWSPDGRYVAYLLRDGAAHQESERGLGLWVLDVTSMRAAKVVEEDFLSSSLVSWTPDSTYVVGYHRGEAGDIYFYAVRPDGGDRRILMLDPKAKILGWMPFTGKISVPKVTVDRWRAEFSDTGGDPVAMADVVAQFVGTQIGTDDKELSRQVAEYLQGAGWEMGLSGAAIVRLSEGQFLAQLPPFSIYVIESGRAQAVAQGNVVLDARLVDGDLGLIFGTIGASAVQPAYVLLRRQADGTWRLLWAPQGQRDWIATDGEIRFAGEGLQKVRVVGSSFGLDYGEAEVFAECHACPHRRLVATWSRQDDRYVRETTLPADAPLTNVYWEMTERTPYALVYECLRRIRQGLPAEELVGGPDVLARIRDLGLTDKGMRLVPEEEMVNGVRFSDLEGKTRFYALVKDGRLLHVERVPG